MTTPDTTPVRPRVLLTEFVILSSSLSAAVGIPTDADAINKSSTPLADFADTFICLERIIKKLYLYNSKVYRV